MTNEITNEELQRLKALAEIGEKSDVPYNLEVEPSTILTLVAKVESLAADAGRLDKLEQIMQRTDSGPHIFSLGRAYEGETMREVLDLVMAKEKA